MKSIKINNKKLVLGTVISTAVLLSGCASSPKASQPRLAEPDYSSIEVLKDVSIEARHELRLLAKMQEASAMSSMTKEQHEQRTYQSLTVPRGFEARQDFYHQGGHAVDAAEALALLTGYDFDVLNEDGSQKIPVSINVKNKPLNEALRELGAQTGDLAEISVDEASNLIIFKYLKKDSSLQAW